MRISRTELKAALGWAVFILVAMLLLRGLFAASGVVDFDLREHLPWMLINSTAAFVGALIGLKMRSRSERKKHDALAK